MALLELLFIQSVIFAVPVVAYEVAGLVFVVLVISHIISSMPPCIASFVAFGALTFSQLSQLYAVFLENLPAWDEFFVVECI